MQLHTLSGAVYCYLDSIILNDKLSAAELNTVLRYIAAWQGGPHSYRDMYGISVEEWKTREALTWVKNLPPRQGKPTFWVSMPALCCITANHQTRKSAMPVTQPPKTSWVIYGIMGYLATSAAKSVQWLYGCMLPNCIRRMQIST